MDGIILSDVPTIINVSCDISLNRSHVPDINFGTDSILLSNNINYYNNKPKHHSIYFSQLVEERERDRIYF